MSKMSQFYTIKEFASLLGVHPTTVRRAIFYGRIQAFRVGQGKKSSYRIYKTEIERMAAFDLTNLIEQRADEMIKERVNFRNNN